MNLLEQIKHSLGLQKPHSHSPSVRPETSALRQALDAGQQAKRGENYPLALEALDHAMRLAVTHGDTSAIAIAALNQADVYIAQQRWPEAENLLSKTYQTAKEARQRPQMAYVLSAQGYLAQAQGDWLGAQRSYEQALEMAKGSRAVGAEGRAMGYLADVYLHETNASYAIRLLREALLRLNLAGDVELSSYFVGRLGQALITSGQVIEGQQMLERALKLANQMNHRQEQRRWSMMLGERAFNEGRFAEAYRYYREGLLFFVPGQRDTVYIQALCQISKICLSLGEQEDALTYAQQAADMAAAHGETLLRAEARAALGFVRVALGAYPEAVHDLEAADTAYGEDASSQPSTQIEIRRNLAAVYGESGETDKAIGAYGRAVQQATSLGLPLEIAQTRRDLGLFYNRCGRMLDAMREWQAALNIYEAEKHTAQAARLYCDLAAARKQIGQGQRAMKDYEQALMLLSGLHEDLEVRGLVLANAAVAYAEQGDVDSAESFFNEAITIARQLGDESAEATRRGNYGWFLLATGKPQQAISTLEYALRLSQSLALGLQSAIQTDNLGLVHDAEGNYPRGLEHHEQALALVKPLQNPRWQALFSINQSRSLIGLGEYDQPEKLLNTALTVGRANGEHEVIIRALTGLGLLALRRGQPGEVPVLLDEATSLARRGDMRRLLAEALTVYSEQQAQINQIERADALWQEAQKLFTILRSPQGKIRPAWLEAKRTSEYLLSSSS